jgi:hypothetical protein
MKEGFSLESFGATIGVGRQTIYRWLDTYPEFKEAREYGHELGLRLFESLIRSKMHGKNYNDTVINQKIDVKKIDAGIAKWFLSMRYRDSYSEQQKMIIEGGNKPVQINSNINLDALGIDDLKKLKEIQEKLNAVTNTKAD